MKSLNYFFQCLIVLSIFASFAQNLKATDQISDKEKASLCGEEIELKEGDEYWKLFRCSNCQSLNVARPEAETSGSQKCPNCGHPHTDKEGWIEPEIEMRNDKVYLRMPGLKIAAGDKLAAAMGGGPVWICPNCSSSMSGEKTSCTNCGAARPADAKVADGDAPVRPKIAPRVEDHNDADYKELDNQKRKVVAAALVTAIGGPIVLGVTIWAWIWAGHSYRAVGVLHSEPNGAYSIDYTRGDKKYHQTLKADGTITVPVGDNGEHGVIHFKNWKGMIGVERDNGDVFTPTDGK